MGAAGGGCSLAWAWLRGHPLPRGGRWLSAAVALLAACAPLLYLLDRHPQANLPWIALLLPLHLLLAWAVWHHAAPKPKNR